MICVLLLVRWLCLLLLHDLLSTDLKDQVRCRICGRSLRLLECSWMLAHSFDRKALDVDGVGNRLRSS